MQNTDDQRIMLIDQDEVVRDSLKILIESHGMQVEEFRSPTDFLERNDFGRQGCVVIGSNRHTVDSLDLLNTLRKRGTRLPVVFIVGGGNALTRTTALAFGAAAYLDRPIEETTLIRTIRDVPGRAPVAGPVAQARPH
ncbi:MAG TPA: response regulator [Pseudolabrys sp.]|nr:response regulator [Pseudolabrys sp.]